MRILLAGSDASWWLIGLYLSVSPDFLRSGSLLAAPLPCSTASAMKLRRRLRFTAVAAHLPAVHGRRATPLQTCSAPQQPDDVSI